MWRAKRWNRGVGGATPATRDEAGEQDEAADRGRSAFAASRLRLGERPIHPVEDAAIRAKEVLDVLADAPPGHVEDVRLPVPGLVGERDAALDPRLETRARHGLAAQTASRARTIRSRTSPASSSMSSRPVTESCTSGSAAASTVVPGRLPS